MSPEILRNLREKYHTDKPLFVQYGRYLQNLCRGDLGVSMKYPDHPGSEIIAQSLPVSMVIGILALVVLAIIALVIILVVRKRREVITLRDSEDEGEDADEEDLDVPDGFEMPIGQEGAQGAGAAGIPPVGQQQPVQPQP